MNKIEFLIIIFYNASCWYDNILDIRKSNVHYLDKLDFFSFNIIPGKFNIIYIAHIFAMDYSLAKSTNLGR